MKKLEYQTDTINDFCLTDCNVIKTLFLSKIRPVGIKIGSGYCKTCSFNKGTVNSDNEKYVLCDAPDIVMTDSYGNEIKETNF